MPERLRDALGGLAAMLLGLAAFLVFCGPAVLIPTNIAWLDFADRAMHTLGWMFYRAAPWGMPPGSNPHLGVELANSIALVDGLPLFAMPFKLLSPWLPQPFQYWGYWLLLSFTLQSLFAYRIARAFGAARLVALVAAAFVLITPAFLFRVPMHLALSGHWVILAAIYLYVRRLPPARWMWPLLCGLTASIHAYLLVMVLGLWVAALIQRLLTRRIGAAAAALEPALALGVTLAVLWTAGFFTARTIATYGYGDYKLNLLWPFIRSSWSSIFPDIPHTKYDYEGLSFLGIGILALLVVAVLSGAVAKLRVALSRHWAPLAIIVVLMMLFALSQNLAFANVELVTLPVPKPLADLFGALRSTGRFVWPLLYLVTIGIVVLVGQRFRAAIALPLLAVAFLAQAADSGHEWLRFRQVMRPPAPVWSTELVSPFWQAAADAGVTRVRAIPVQNPGRDWKPLGYFAITHGMEIDTAYLGRVDDRAMEALKAHEAEVLDTGEFELNTLYVLDDTAAKRARRHITDADMFAVIDKRIVFLRNGASLAKTLGIDPHSAVTH